MRRVSVVRINVCKFLFEWGWLYEDLGKLYFKFIFLVALNGFSKSIHAVFFFFVSQCYSWQLSLAGPFPCKAINKILWRTTQTGWVFDSCCQTVHLKGISLFVWVDRLINDSLPHMFLMCSLQFSRNFLPSCDFVLFFLIWDSWKSVPVYFN